MKGILNLIFKSETWKELVTKPPNMLGIFPLVIIPFSAEICGGFVKNTACIDNVVLIRTG